jgi:hypothetical protein
MSGVLIFQKREIPRGDDAKENDPLSRSLEAVLRDEAGGVVSDEVGDVACESCSRGFVVP